ncbi:MAG TPA: hydroxymethylbilane synthase [Chitinophagales bacterium]|nr:hydroxymethylbilane synthase [Chitinophagales bacterium]
MKQFKIVCRSSSLSVIQAEIARQYLLNASSDIEIEIVLKETSGDLDQSRPLYELEGRDFFSKEIDEYLLTGKADFAVHSMKDLSGDRLEDARFVNAAPERNDPRDFVIFNPDVLDKIAAGKPLVIGTSSLRRQLQAINFLKKSLPVVNGLSASTETKTIRGNVDTRLQQLQDRKFDGIILASAGLNRLLTGGNSNVASLLSGKRKMFLPLIECAPAPGQGALLIECLKTNSSAAEILASVNNTALSAQLETERNSVTHLGGGCHQQYGSVYIDTPHGGFVNVAGIDEKGNDVSDMLFDVSLDIAGKKLFSAGDYMKDFFSYEFQAADLSGLYDVVFVAHHRAVTPAIAEQLKDKKVWCSGSRSWYELAKLGIWCEGCADGLGFDFLSSVFKQPLTRINKQDINILTTTQAAEQWEKENVVAVGTYKLIPNLSKELCDGISGADIIYWTNFEQYLAAKHLLKAGVTHACPSGKTAELFLKNNIEPVVFPGIKAFNIWRKKNTI